MAREVVAAKGAGEADLCVLNEAVDAAGEVAAHGPAPCYLTTDHSRQFISGGEMHQAGPGLASGLE